jgi:hypothetical protein
MTKQQIVFYLAVMFLTRRYTVGALLNCQQELADIKMQLAGIKCKLDTNPKLDYA